MDKYYGFIKLLDDYSEIKRGYVQQQESNFNAIFNGFSEAKTKTQQIVKNTSSDLNVFKIFKIPEVIHSEILGDFLSSTGVHGQGDLFLKRFLEKLGIENPNKGTWRVSVERGNIDVLLKRNYPKSIIVIENKSNWAVDQNNQLYRYWHQEMYEEIRQKGKDFWSQNSNKYRIIYLPPDVGKVPSQNSISRPEYMDSKLPSKIPLELDRWSFNNQIVN